VRDYYPYKTISSDIPLLIGSSSHAIAFWPGPRDLYNWTWNTYNKYVTTSLDSFGPRLSQMTLELYPSSIQSDLEPMTPQLQYITMVSDLKQICPVNYLSEVLALKAKNPNIFRYVINARTSKPVSDLSFSCCSLKNFINFYKLFKIYSKCKKFLYQLISMKKIL